VSRIRHGAHELAAELRSGQNCPMNEDHPADRARSSVAQRVSSLSSLDGFCARVLCDVALQERLRAPDDIGEFIALTIEAARQCGIELDVETLSRAMFRLPGMEVVGGERIRTPSPPAGWLPTAAFWQGDELLLEWSHFGYERLRDPFFEGSVQRCLSKPFNRLFHHCTPITALAEWLRDRPALQPSGLIFHMSRCGSTLVSAMLASLDRNLVISEAPPIDAVVRASDARPDLERGQHSGWLAAVIAALCQPRCGEANSFIKLDCWHTLALPLFRATFPDVPWVFLCRDPVEVLVSQLRMPGIHMIPGMLGPHQFAAIASYAGEPREDYYARVLAAICAPVLTHHADGGLIVDYRDLPQALWTKILPHFGIACSESDRAVMVEAARFDAKSPFFAFTPDSEAKRQAASASVRAVAARHLGGIYRLLEEFR
jgi:hypothetical protein